MNKPVLVVHPSCEYPKMLCEHVLMVPPPMENAAKCVLGEVGSELDTPFIVEMIKARFGIANNELLAKYKAAEQRANADVANRPENIDANLLNCLISHLEHLKKVYVVPNDNYGPDVDILQEWIDWLNRHAG